MTREIRGALGARPIVLVGMMGAGKSSLGRALARRLALRFIDSDKEIEAKIGKSITRIFAEDREAHFRNLEANEIKHVLEQGPAVLSTGGGAFMIDDVRHHIGRKAVSIWLNTNEDVIRQNLKHNTKRPKLRTADQEKTISDLMQAGNSIYRLANLTIAPQHRRDLKSADACMTALHAHLCDAGQGTRQAGLFQELPDAPGSENAKAPSIIVEQVQAAASSSARVQSSGIHVSPEAPLDLPSTSDALHDEALRPPSTKAPDARRQASDSTASLQGRRLVLGAEEWLGDEHITADYALLEQELHRANPGLVAQIRIVPPAPVQLLRLARNRNDVEETLGGIVRDHNGNEANYLLLPVNDGEAGEEGSHWSLLLVDRRAPGRILAYHYDSDGNRNRAAAEELAARLDARLTIADMAQQQNGYDCGVFVLDATRALVRRLAEGEQPAQLRLSNIGADRQALRDRLGAFPGVG
ncbi:shikimate kinase [Bradyrhizobium ivorense]|uniref:shikimate kinase n=1 Tax=Bradyrhizobium ivorense TaxID=2511166 RepID=UPI0010B42C5D|nr:shikimate kinase [Bradyrhizobium ivorense]VIO79212.1 Shikimate kinase [Bradyrhizobium ivorense]